MCIRDRANLFRADLTGANLSGAILTVADLTGANLTETILDSSRPCPEATAALRAAGMTVRNGTVYAYRTATSQHVGTTDYTTPGEYVAPVFSMDPTTDCHPGLYFASLEWLKDAYPDKPLVGISAAVSDVVATTEGKFRARRLISHGLLMVVPR